MLKNFDISKLRLYPDPTAENLCEVIAKKNNCRRENIMVTNGSDEALTYIFNAFISNKKNVVFTNPTYTVYQSLAERFDIGFSIIETEEDFSIDLEKVPNAENTVFVLVNPNAQTGLYIEIENIQKFLANFKGLLIVDEAYIDFAPKSSVELINKYDNIIVTKTLSKSYSLCGIRLGYAISNRHNIDALYRVKDSYNINMLTQIIGAEAVNDDGYMKKNSKLIISERTRVSSTLKQMGFSLTDSKSNFILARPPQNNAKYIFEKLKDSNIYIRYFDTPRLAEYIRITISSEAQNNALIEAISNII